MFKTQRSNYPEHSKDFPAFQVALVRRLTSAEFVFLFMVLHPYGGYHLQDKS